MIEELKKQKVGKIIPQPLMKDHTTYKVGGPALAMVYPSDIEELKRLIKYVRNNNIKYKIVGKGSNLVFNDAPYDGIIIKLDRFDDLKIEAPKFIVGAGYSTVKFAMKVSRLGYTGMEFATGIPGSIGGAVFMNAGAYNSDMGYVVSEIKVLTPQLEVKTMYNRDLDFHYRTSFLQKNPDYICLEATIVLKKGDADTILQVIEDRKQRRLLGQPLEYPSAGSVFRNPEGDFAGRLIEELGYKGKKLGGAMVSEKHANFIVNDGSATGEDIKNLIQEIQEKVKEKYDIDLKIEQEFVE